MLYQEEDFVYNAIDEYNWDYECWEMVDFGVSASGWLTADDSVFWCLAPAYLEEVIWLFNTAPAKQPHDSMGYPITLLEYYLRMDLSEMLDRVWLAPKKIHDGLCMVWTRVTKRRNLSTINDLIQSSGPELEWLFQQDPDLSLWMVSLKDPVEDCRISDREVSTKRLTEGAVR